MVLRLDLKQAKHKADLAVTSLHFPEDETNMFYTGAEDGSVAQVMIHGNKKGIVRYPELQRLDTRNTSQANQDVHIN
eukprot:gene118-78_t